MYKNGIPAEYLARQALHVAANNSSQNPRLRNVHHHRSRSQKPIRRRETTSAMTFLGSLKEPQSDAS